MVFDTETNGLLDQVTRVHCLVLRDMESDSVVSCTDSAPGFTSIAEGLSLLSEAETVYGHNIIKYDEPVLKKMYPGFRFKGVVRDTLVTASMRWAHIEGTDWEQYRKGTMPAAFIGKHSLEAWGHRLGVLKGDYKKTHSFEKWTPEMQQYCDQDTVVCKALVQRIRAAGLSAQALEIEHELAYYLFQQERNGWPFDMDKAIALQGLLVKKREAVETELRSAFEPWSVSMGIFIPKRDNKAKGYKKGVPIERFRTVEFNPASRDHIADRLQKLYGWQPEEVTEGGKPKVDENTLKGISAPPVAKLREYLLLAKRLGQLAEGKEAWLTHATNKGPEGGLLTGLMHIHGGVIQNRAITHRASHVHPNLGQVPKVGNPYGEECRELFYAGPPGWIQVGADASGLELRVLAHYMAQYDSGVYATTLLQGDVHSITQQALIEWVGEGKKGRDKAKTWMYAFLYGAGDEKLGKILSPGLSKEIHKRVGEKSRALYLGKLPALQYLLKDIRNKVISKGYVVLIDGRRCYIRSEHAALNSLIQGTGAIICKRWIVEYNRRLVALFGPQGWRGLWAALGWIHDETQVAVRKRADLLMQVPSVLVESIRHMTTHFTFRCPLDGEAKLGANWKETH